MDPHGNATDVQLINRIKVETNTLGQNQWIKGVFLDIKSEMLCVWSSHSIYMYPLLPLSTGDLKNKKADSAEQVSLFKEPLELN